MNAVQTSKLKMYIGVRDYLAKFLSLLASLPNFTKFYEALQDLIVLIQSLAEAQQLDKTGSTTAKKKSRVALITLAADTARKLVAYATDEEDDVLLTEMKTSETKLNRLSDVKLRNAVANVYDCAQTNLANLALYLIDADSQTTLQAAITSFDSFLATPRLASAESTQNTMQLMQQFKNGDATCERLDGIINIIRSTQVDFYNGYKTIRKLMNVGGATLAINGKITSAATGLGLQGASITFTLQSSDTQSTTTSEKTIITKKSSKKGGFRVSSASEGTYQVTVELPGYKTATATLNVISGQMSTLDVAMGKA